jgi:hypothetical protein
MPTSLLAVSVDGSDIARLAQFWSDVLDRPVNPGATVSFAAIDGPNGSREIAAELATSAGCDRDELDGGFRELRPMDRHVKIYRGEEER